MKHISLLLLVALLLTPPAALYAEEYYVAPTGNDTNPGTQAKPFATLERARDAVRVLEQHDGTTVFVRGGVYELEHTLKLDAKDSGITWRAFQNEKPVLIGGRRITGFTTFKGNILKAPGIKNVHFRQLFFDGQRQHLARYPNFDPQNPYGGGWAYAAGEPVPAYKDIPGENNHTLQFAASDARKWAHPEDGEVFVFPRNNWVNNIVRIKEIDADQHRITLAADCSYAIRPGDRYYVQNLLEELDAPGEWYLDKKDWTLYFWPPSPLAEKAVDAPTMRTILEIGPGTSHVTVRGLTFEYSEGTAIVLSKTEECRIAGCTIRNVGDYGGSGVSIQGGTNNGVVGCDISGIGRDGVSISGGDRKTLSAANNYADNNYIHHVGVFYKQGVGIALQGVGNRATHNLIHDGPRMGIMFSGNNLVIEYNHIRHVNLETQDTGAVYTGGRDWISSRGSVIRWNYFHDILGYGWEKGKWVSPYFAWGVYLDDNTGGVDVTGNIIARCPRGGLLLHNGRDNRIENNIFIDCGQQQIECNGWTANSAPWARHFKTMVEGYEMVANEPAWQSMRNMKTHPKDAVLPDGTIMSGNVFRRNIISYRDPLAKLFSFRNVNFDHYEADSNLVWHFGLPLLTGQKKVGGELSENLVQNPGFESGKPNELPDGWQWQTKPDKATADWVRGNAAEGERALRITSGPGKNIPQIVSAELTVAPGKHYRLSGMFKADKPGEKVALMLQSYVPKEFFWVSSPQEATVGTDWTSVEFVFNIPQAGENAYHEQMKKFRVRIDLREPSCSLLVDKVKLVEVKVLDEWAAWQAMGLDQHSQVADPLFVDPEHDNYQLKPESPALELGIENIPVDRIGPFQDELRASWPIIEAEGVREKPLPSQLQKSP